MEKKYRVKLSAEEREELKAMVFQGAFCSVQADPCPHPAVGRRGARGRGYEG